MMSARLIYRRAGALALREGIAFFPHRGAYHLNVERFRKHPQFIEPAPVRAAKVAF